MSTWRHSFLLDRPGLKEGYHIPTKLRCIDTVSVLFGVLWFFLSLWCAFECVRFLAQLGALPNWGRGALAFVVWIALTVLLVSHGHGIIMAGIRCLLVRTQLISVEQSKCFPLPVGESGTSPWPESWQARNDNHV